MTATLLKQIELFDRMHTLPLSMQQELTDIFFDLNEDEKMEFLLEILSGSVEGRLIQGQVKLMLRVYEDMKLDLIDIDRGGFKGVF